VTSSPLAPDTADAPTDPLGFASAEGELWCVCHTKPRCEKKFAALLTAERMAHYLPTVTNVRIYGSRKRSSELPLFPSYVFARVPTEHKSRIFQQNLLVRVLDVPDETLLLRQLTDVQRVVDSGIETALHNLFQRGDPVRVMSGPLRGLEGVIDDPQNPSGIVIAVDVLQQGLHISVPMSDLKILPR
jgi:transcription antitermination factor NusG